MKKINNLGFTLIELLVVITIIAILATVGVNQFGKSLQKARDSKRTSDILSIKTAVTQAFTDDMEYPSTSSSDTNFFSGAISPYIDQLPKDEKHLQPGNKSGGEESALAYTYISGDDEGGIQFATYEISTSYEAESNIKNVAKKDNGNDDNRYEIGNVVNGGGITGGMNTELKKGSTCNNVNNDANKAIIIGDTIFCAATPY